MHDENEKNLKRGQFETSDTMQSLIPRRPRREDQCTIYGRNPFSLYVNDSNQKVRYALYWLDINIHDQADLEAELRHIIPEMQRFDNAKECEEEIKNATSCTVVLIVAISMAISSVPLVHDLSCVTKIFIYSVDHTNDDGEPLMKTYDKVAAVVSTERDLIEKISEDWEGKEKRSALQFSAVNHWDVSLETRSGNILWFKLLISLLTRFENKNNTAKGELVNFMRSSYYGNAPQLARIATFEQIYLAKDAIGWYTRDFCLYRLVNKAFRQGNVNSLFSLRLFIQDLYAQLTSLHAEQRQIRCKTKQPIVRSFRGQVMLSSEVTNFSRDQYAITTSFFSTTLDREQALGFLAGGVASNAQILVCFVINANISLNSAPFADITAVSNIESENEILYVPGALFRIKSIIKDAYNDVLLIELELCGEDDLPMKAIYDSFRIEHNQDVYLRNFGMLLYHMGDYRKADKFLLRLSNELTTAGADLALCYHALGRVAHGIDDYGAAVLYQEAALEILMSVIPTDFNTLAHICNNLAQGYCSQERFILAIDFNEFAIESSLQIDDTHLRSILLGNCYHTGGRIYLMQQQDGTALRWLKVSLDYHQRSYPSNHPFIAEIYMSIGMVYFRMGKNDEALQISNMARDIFLKTLPLTHPLIGDVLYNLANIELKIFIRDRDNEVFQRSMAYFLETYDIFHYSLPARSCRFLLAKETVQNNAKAQVTNDHEKSRHITIITEASILF